MSTATPPPPATEANRAPGEEGCPLCGAPLGAEQEWCVQCGAAARTRLAATPSWRTPVIALSVVIVLSLGALTAALVSLAGDSGKATASGTAGSVTLTTTTPATAGGSSPAAGAPAATTPATGLPTQSTPAATTPGAPGTGTSTAPKGNPNATLPSERGGAVSSTGAPGAGASGSTKPTNGAPPQTPTSSTPAKTPTSTAPGAQANKGKAMEKLLKAIERHGSQAAGAPTG